MTGTELRERAGRVCMAVAGDAMFRTVMEAGAKFVEFRLDSLAEPANAMVQLRQCFEAQPGLVGIATCRRSLSGGAYDGSAREQVDVLLDAVQAGCALVDLEVETAEELGADVLRELRRAGAAVIVSWHDFAATPDLEAVLQRMRPFAPDLYKIVPTATTLHDALRVIDLLENHGGGGNLVAMAMGFRGLLTRVLGPRCGSVFTFAAADGSEATAPGQVSLRTMQELYRVEMVNPATAVYAVAGQPITGSKSPLMHNTAFAAAGLDAVYLPLETDDVTELTAVVERLNVRGLSVTMPLKQAVLPLLESANEGVHATGACNTLLRRDDGQWHGLNTDIAGVVEPLAKRMKLEGARVLVLGAGGAARAAVFGLKQAGARVWVLNRTLAKAKALAAEFGVEVLTREQLGAMEFDAMVHTTPYGMRGQVNDEPVAAEEMHCRVFFDTVYNPIETPLIGAAKGHGIAVIAGVEMFAEQGARQWAAWTGQDAPMKRMLDVVVSALAAES